MTCSECKYWKQRKDENIGDCSEFWMPITTPGWYVPCKKFEAKK